ncbi:unnamed protein product [Caenorhabditis bovis]|uniref:Uncharacterized protein n=1 Tax=Caenorhabditis bovis TaxID=2654633 RepID=A0A8S1EI86_9PELO|nr:unnamed protein product [Caenorhabditis bovis]
MGRDAMIFGLLLAVICHADGSEVFSSSPQDDPYYVRDGASGPVLPCALNAPYSDRSQYEVNWARYNNGQLRIIARNDKMLEKKDARFALLNDPLTGNYSLKIVNVQRESVEGSYHCNVIANDDSGTQYSSKKATVVVLVPPGDPVISEAPDEPVAEGDTVTVKCMSIGGSPEPTFTFRVTAEDNGASVKCSVNNKAMDDNELKTSSSSRLNVLFKPRVHVSPLENMTHLSVEAGELVNLTCNADANPPVHSYEWKHLASGERYQAQVWPMHADKAMSGDYECRATNQLGDGSDILKLNVQYAPQISVPISVSPNEKEKVEIDCLVDANPAITEIKWIGPNGFKMDGSVLILKSISREQTGNYTCIATNFLNIYGQSGSQQRVGTGITFVDVKRKPGPAKITIIKEDINVGDVIELRCEAPDAGNPKASYKWASPSSGGEYGSNEHDRETLIVRNAQLSDNGEYRCLPYNELGAGKEAVFRVTVIEPAKISSPLTTERIFSAGEVKKNLECEAQGYPTPEISWYKDGKLLTDKRYIVTSNVAKSRCADDDYCTQSTYSSLTMTGPLRWSDKGNFTCITNNGGSASLEEKASWTIVRIMHSPVMLNQRFGGKALAAADIGTQARLSCLVSARPEPEFHWVYKGADIKENEKYSVHMVPVRGRPDEYEQVLQIENVQEKDYGEYLCRASNGNGGDNVVIEMKKTGIPDIPDDLQKVSSTPHSINLGWRPKFGGGYLQTFTVEYRKLNPFTGSIEEAIAETLEIRNATKFNEYKDDGSIDFGMRYNLSGLTPLSTYYVRLRAVNEKGASEFTPMIVASTNDVHEDKNMMSPSRLIYKQNKQTIEIEPRPPMDACTLLYVLVEDSWRASDCFVSSKPIPNVLQGNKYKARFCMAQAPFKCSPMSPVTETGSSSSWKAGTLVPIMFVIFIILSICVFFIVCCRTRVPTNKSLKMTPVTLSALPTAETKNAIVHGSQADSGVFTLDSTRLKSNIAPTQHTYSSSNSDETAVENWNNDDSHYDVSSDPYLTEANTNIFQAGVLEDQKMDRGDSPSVTGTEDSDGRRIMREIIV